LWLSSVAWTTEHEEKQVKVYISPTWGEAPVEPIWTKFGSSLYLTEVINRLKLGVDLFGSFGSGEVHNSPFPIGKTTGPYHCSATALARDYVRSKGKVRFAIRLTNLMTCYERVMFKAKTEDRTCCKTAYKPRIFPIHFLSLAHFHRSNFWPAVAGWLKRCVLAWECALCVCKLWKYMFMGSIVVFFASVGQSTHKHSEAITWNGLI